MDVGEVMAAAAAPELTGAHAQLPKVAMDRKKRMKFKFRRLRAVWRLVRFFSFLDPFL
jgi:hypothetical protein